MTKAGVTSVTKTAVTREARVTSVTKRGVMSGTKGTVTSVTKEVVMSGTKGAAMRGTMRPVTRVTGTMTAATIGKMTRAIKAASIGKAMANRGNAMASEQRLSLNLAEWNSFRCYSGKDARPHSAAIRERDRGIRAPNDAGRQRRAALAVAKGTPRSIVLRLS